MGGAVFVRFGTIEWPDSLGPLIKGISADVATDQLTENLADPGDERFETGRACPVEASTSCSGTRELRRRSRRDGPRRGQLAHGRATMAG